MITDALQAWVIHKYWSGDTSVRVVFFTEELGLVNCFYKGGRTPKKQALLQAFLPLWLVMDKRGEAYFVRNLEMSASSLSLLGQSLFAGLYVNELLHLMLQLQDAHPALYFAYQEALHAISMAEGRSALEVILRRFERSILSACGYHLSLTHDVYSLDPIDKNSYYRFLPGEGFISADNGILGAHIIALEEDKLDNSAVLQAAKRIMRCAIDHALDGRAIKTRALYR